MLVPLTTWLDAARLPNAMERRQAGLVQVMFIGLMVAIFPSLVLSQINQSAFSALRLVALGVIFATAAAGLWLVRHAQFRAGVLTVALGLVSALAVFAALQGVFTNTWLLAALIIPVALVGLLLSRAELMLVIALCAAVVGGAGALESVSGPLGGAARQATQSWPMAMATFALLAGVLGVFFDRLSGTLRTALAESHAREQELEELKASLESSVAARTSELRATVEQLQATQATVRELGAPVLPVLPGVLAAPIIGALDSARAAHLSTAVLEAIDRTRARTLILDITGVPVVDTQVAQALLRVAQAARLLGAEAMLVGISAEVAQTMVTLGVSLGAVRVYPSLQEAIGALLQTRGAPGAAL